MRPVVGGGLFALAGLVLSFSVGAAVLGLGRDHWKENTFSDIPATEYLVKADGTILIIANQSSSILHRRLSPKEREGTALAWEWRVQDPVPPTDLTQKGEDDRAVAVHIWFKDKKGGLFAGIKRSLAKLSGRSLRGKAISYTWGGTQEPGTVLENPFMKGDGVIIVLRGEEAPTGKWIRERVDFMADFEAAFGYRPDPPKGIAISGDSDNTGVMSRASVRDIHFMADAEDKEKDGP